MNDLIESIGAALEELSDEQRTDLKRSVLVLSTAYFARRSLRKFLVGLGVPEAAAKHAYGAAAAVAWAVSSNATAGFVLSKRSMDDYV